MNYIIGSIDPNIIGNYKDINYIQKPFNDLNTIEKWKSLGHNYEKYTGSMYDQSNLLPKWCEDVKKNIFLKKSTVTLYCMTPGTIMPEHEDKFLKYKEVMNLNNSIDIGRAIVFLENWKSGHYFEIDGSPLVNWKQGDYVIWKNNVPHMAANLGSDNRYTMQITGIYCE